VRLGWRQRVAALLGLGLGLAALAASAQNPEAMGPDASTAKAKQIVKQLIDALGGPLYFSVKSVACEGRMAQFGHNGETTGYIAFKEYRSYPDKRRIDYSKKDNVIDVFAGDEGWTLDRGGVSEEPVTSVADFQAALKRDPNNLLRTRLDEGGMFVSYGGIGIADLRTVDWIDFQDNEERTIRLGVDRSTHLLLRSVVKTVNEDTRERQEDVTVYSNYQFKDGVQLPMQITRERDGRRLSQVFYESCQLNPQLPPDLFTRAALERRYKELGGGKTKGK
jgi:outer membrane lipoprotein-sorting protein